MSPAYGPPATGPTDGTATVPAGTVVLGTMETYGPSVTGVYGLGLQITIQVATGDIGSFFLSYANFTQTLLLAGAAQLAGYIALAYSISNPST